MKRIALVLIAAFLASRSASAQVWTKKFDWQPQKGLQVLDWKADGGIEVRQIEFDLGQPLKPTQLSSAGATILVDNNTDQNLAIGVAVAVFDAEDRLVGAGNGGVKLGTLGKWKREAFRIGFGHVFAHLASAKYFLVTVEKK